MENKETDKKALEVAEMENVSGGDAYNNNPSAPNNPPQPQRRIIGYKTRCPLCGSTGEVHFAPGGQIMGAVFCQCGRRMENVEPIYA